MRRFKVNDIVVTSASDTHKRIYELPFPFARLEWWDGAGRETEYVHHTHLTFIDSKPTEDFNYYYLMHKK